MAHTPHPSLPVRGARPRVPLPACLRPQARVSGRERRAGLRMVMLDGMASQSMGVLTGGAFLVAYALLLGASPLMIGLIAALQPLTQVLQIPTVYLVERSRRRKALVVLSSFGSRLAWFFVAAMPLFVPEAWRPPLLMVALAVYFGLGTVGGLAWSAWMHDFVPQRLRGRFMGRRMAAATATGAALSLAAGFGVDAWKAQLLPEIGIYSLYFALGGVAGMIGLYTLARTPEPAMRGGTQGPLLPTLAQPLRDANFRKLILFLGTWSFAVNLAAPFFTVYMLLRLELAMGPIIALAVLSQAVNVMFFNLWGRLSDRYSNKSVLVDSGPLFILTFLIWPFTSLTESTALAIALLILIHALAGMSTAGVNLCTGNIALKLAPRGKATAYLAVNALVSGVAATLAPILGGVLATLLANEVLVLDLHWISASGATRDLPALRLQGLDFVFLLSFVLGLYALHRLLAVKENGEVPKGVVFGEFHLEIRKILGSVSNVAGLRDLFYFPYNLVRRGRPRSQR